MWGMTDINPAAAAARENARTGTGQFGAQEHSAPELVLALPPSKHDDPRYVEGVSEFDDDLSDEEWFECYGPAEVVPPEPFVWDGSYKNHEQVRPYLADFLRVYDEVERPGRGFAYNDDFKGRIPAIEGPHEDTAIYMLQNMRRRDAEDAEVAKFVESGAREVDVEDIPAGATLRGTIALHRFYSGDTGLKFVEGARLRRAPSGRQLEYVEKGKRQGHIIGSGTVLIREG
jgi:hypothetical protein